ncbi:MAG TPA: phosphoribosylaminoimidazolesuccinocarboxamide synthase [Candidatus Avimonas sp.]|jgi:phosphoribosylaminoimidazole-succinocarboxamide synthase|nr:phosphoribosylaminoimidazolesuccinocarboxamide synthase [Clostridiales bacterium]HOB36290.1 phosphoribosylaminoimidazolesuccinocarboxamide synthase [Candidatus Avimonas sp.]HQA16246.1 phosphoribosylaminoimidazolesuccinocarboxamide synthase [Candidatus Avimonas sp.]HQD37830.1 phosphoribosylaminoimidazolesuccinocarboxamide synthase [Candidatus Avimonas sp.]
MRKLKMLYEGKAKKVFETDSPDLLIVEYKDDATAFDGKKKGTIANKGVVNNRMTNILMQLLEKEGIPTHYVKEISDRETVVKKVSIIPLEVIVRNIAAGSFSKRFGVEEGTPLKQPSLEYSYKNDTLGDPMINDYHILALGLATKDELGTVSEYAFKINDILKSHFLKLNIQLVDFKLEFGKTTDGDIVLADEISPDTCRFWDVSTGEKLDKDRFRRDLGGESEAYREVFRRLTGQSL